MIRKPDEDKPLPPPEILPGPPTQPGWYWFKGDPAMREVMVEVRLVDVQLTLNTFFRDDVPVSDAKRYWRSPLRPILHGHGFFKPLILP